MFDNKLNTLLNIADQLRMVLTLPELSEGCQSSKTIMWNSVRISNWILHQNII